MSGKILGKVYKDSVQYALLHTRDARKQVIALTINKNGAALVKEAMATRGP
jgi:hypothetical protein